MKKLISIKILSFEIAIFKFQQFGIYKTNEYIDIHLGFISIFIGE